MGYREISCPAKCFSILVSKLFYTLSMACYEAFCSSAEGEMFGRMGATAAYGSNVSAITTLVH
jgi:hypothetical protein